VLFDRLSNKLEGLEKASKQGYKKGEGFREIRIFQLKYMVKNPNMRDEIPNTLFLTSSGSELIRRMNAKECEYCGQIELPTQVHHVRKLKDLKSKPYLEFWQKVMGSLGISVVTTRCSGVNRRKKVVE